MSSLNVSAQLNLEELFRPVLVTAQMRIQEAMEECAAKIITEEMAKFTIDLAKIVSFQDFRDQLVITIKKEIK